ncbi:uncharacterized protein LOC123529866 isoform X2 [Mercenaria mercenaria]|uniref:uncharacterized protein LOC123529866 isoform X2 n=1 Tax=Mercenaria mercenaria TaxID=6596 RepID=UPI00234F6365|nr:uncharacterized protein LOC123529866 isoform X2 [Mercenaria mercenaria]
MLWDQGRNSRHTEIIFVNAEVLHRLFPQPKKVVDDLFAPFQKAEEGLIPKLEVRRKLRDSICKTKLTFHWPTTVDVCGIHTDEDTSVYNAYLQACHLLKGMGLVKESDTETRPGVYTVYTVDNVLKILEELASMQCTIGGYEPNNYRVINLLQHNQDEDVCWTSSLQVQWPICFTVNSKSTCLDLAYYQSCLKAVMKFKAFGYLNQQNHFRKGILLALERYDNHPLNINIVTRDLTNPDFELFVDASAHGMGAYLISRDDEKIRWLADPWIPSKIKFEPRSQSYIAEFYAFVTAVYTWKHKFVEKKVICYSDNMYAINLINHGIYTSRKSKRNESIHKLYMLLMEVCFKYNITVVGVHVPRMNNVAADLLSRCDVNSFKKIVPTAYDNPKKSKKLWFCLNKKDDENDKNKDDKKPKPSS